MLTTMVAGPGPTFCENGARPPNQVPETPEVSTLQQQHIPSAPPPPSTNGQLSPTPPQCNVTATSSTHATAASTTVTVQSTASFITTSVTTRAHNSSTMTNGSCSTAPSMVAVVPSDVCPPPQYTPPPIQQPGPPYCSQEFIPGDLYYSGHTAEYSQHHPQMCTLHHGVPGNYVLVPIFFL